MTVLQAEDIQLKNTPPHSQAVELMTGLHRCCSFSTIVVRHAAVNKEKLLTEGSYLCSIIPWKWSQNFFFYIKYLRPHKQLQCNVASKQHSELTGIIVEIIVVVIGGIIVWKQAMSSGLCFSLFDFTQALILTLTFHKVNIYKRKNMRWINIHLSAFMELINNKKLSFRRKLSHLSSEWKWRHLVGR